LEEQAKDKKQTPPPSPTPQPADEKLPSSPVYEDIVSYESEATYKNSNTIYSTVHEPESSYKAKESEYDPETVYEVAGAGDLYQAEENTYDEYENELGITAIALYIIFIICRLH
ncbi:Src substrate protein p85, partial [Chelonia mydas]